jgi:hypothetical protein
MVWRAWRWTSISSLASSHQIWTLNHSIVSFGGQEWGTDSHLQHL